jgi:hypothetical protein
MMTRTRSHDDAQVLFERVIPNFSADVVKKAVPTTMIVI